MYTFITDLISFFMFLYALKIRIDSAREECREDRIEKLKEASICVFFGWLVLFIGHY